MYLMLAPDASTRQTLAMRTGRA